MVAFVLSLIWRQLGSVAQAMRMLNEEGMLWQPPLKISQQALSERLRTLNAELVEDILNQVLPLKGSLALFDLGFVNYERYQQLSETGRFWVSRVKSNMAYHKLEQLTNGVGLREWRIEIGRMAEGTGQILRLVEVQYEGRWYSYVSNVLDQARLSGAEIEWLYRQRWRIEDAFRLVKRLLGLAYFADSSINAIKVQVWMSWLLYAVLIDLTDEVAQELKKPFGAISTEMVYRGLYHYAQALDRGKPKVFLSIWQPKLNC